MPLFTITIKPHAGGVVEGTAKTQGAEGAKASKEPIVHKVLVHEGLPDSFDVELDDEQELRLSLKTTGRLVFDKDQFTARVVDETPEMKEARLKEERRLRGEPEDEDEEGKAKAAKHPLAPPPLGTQQPGPSSKPHPTAARPGGKEA